LFGHNFYSSFSEVGRLYLCIPSNASQAFPSLFDCASTGSLLLETAMGGLLIHWLISTASLLIVSYLLPGIAVRSIGSALIASIVIGLINATLGIVLKILTLPLTLLTFGLFLLVINALMLQLASYLVPGFFVSGFWSAFFGAIVLSLVSMALRSLIA
jgi:putative membrane protein